MDALMATLARIFQARFGVAIPCDPDGQDEQIGPGGIGLSACDMLYLLQDIEAALGVELPSAFAENPHVWDISGLRDLLVSVCARDA